MAVGSASTDQNAIDYAEQLLSRFACGEGGMTSDCESGVSRYLSSVPTTRTFIDETLTPIITDHMQANKSLSGLDFSSIGNTLNYNINLRPFEPARGTPSSTAFLGGTQSLEIKITAVEQENCDVFLPETGTEVYVRGFIRVGDVFGVNDGDSGRNDLTEFGLGLEEFWILQRYANDVCELRTLPFWSDPNNPERFLPECESEPTLCFMPFWHYIEIPFTVGPITVLCN